MGLISRVSSRTYRINKYYICFFSYIPIMDSENFNYNKTGGYQAYYKAQAPPGGKSSICFGGPEPEKPMPKQQQAPVDEAQKENSQPGSARSTASEKNEDKVVTKPVVNTKPEPILPKSNNIFGETDYPIGEKDKQGTQPQVNKKSSTRVI